MNSRKKQIILTLNPPNYKWDVKQKTNKFKKKKIRRRIHLEQLKQKKNYKIAA